MIRLNKCKMIKTPKWEIIDMWKDNELEYYLENILNNDIFEIMEDRENDKIQPTLWWQNKRIKSVKRVSDGYIFSIGDLVVDVDIDIDRYLQNDQKEIETIKKSYLSNQPPVYWITEFHLPCVCDRNERNDEKCWFCKTGEYHKKYKNWDIKEYFDMSVSGFGGNILYGGGIKQKLSKFEHFNNLYQLEKEIVSIKKKLK